MKSNIEVDFQHFQYTFSEAELVKYGSPHFSEKEIGERLVDHMLRGINNRSREFGDIDIPQRHQRPDSRKQRNDPVFYLRSDERRSGHSVEPYPDDSRRRPVALRLGGLRLYR